MGQMMDGLGLGSMGTYGLLILIVVILVGAAAIKYLFFDDRRNQR